ncbi:MAG TPA: hypothetical protein VMJ10_12480 [Kofleriaceae bacterium]|nr:hypothetical protein [Kofleriaceae bacterium]
MVRIAAAVAAIAAAGCAQVFGIANTTGPNDADTGASLAVTRISVGATVVTAPQDLTGQTATFYAPDVDPTMLDATTGVLTGGESWNADVPGTPLVMFTLPAYPMMVTRGLALPAAAQQYGYVVLEHPNPTVADANAMVTVQATLPTPFASGESLQFYAIGPWAVYNLTTLPNPGTTAVNSTFSYSSATSVTGRPLESFTTADRVLLLRYLNGVLTGAGEAAPLAQSSTSTTVVVSPFTAVTAALTGTLALDQITLAQRFGQTMPLTSTLGISWTAAAEAAPGVFVGPVLQSGIVGATDTQISFAFGNPFAATNQWGTALSVVATASRTFTPASPALPATLTATLSQLVDPTTMPTLDFSGGLPTAVAINGTTLSDGASVSIDPTAAVTVAITADRTANTLYTVQLISLAPNAANTALDQQVVFTVTGTSPTFTLPPQLFPSGLYTLRAICDAGTYPGATSGVLTMQAFPDATGSLESGVFTVP